MVLTRAWEQRYAELEAMVADACVSMKQMADLNRSRDDKLCDDRPDPKPIYEIKADKEIPKASSKSKRRYKLQKRISCEELDERTMKGLCVFCEEPETPGHYLQHMNSCLLMIDSEDHLSDPMVNKIGNEISSDRWLSNSIGCELEIGETDNDEDRVLSDSDLLVNDIEKVKKDLVAMDVDSETDLLTENNQQFQEQAKNRFTTSVMQPSLEVEAMETKSSAQEIGSSATNNVQVIEWIHEEESEKERKWEDVKQSSSLQSYYDDQVKSTELVVRDQMQEIRSDVVNSPWVSVKRDGAVETPTCISRRANHVWKPGEFVHPKIQLDWLERADSNHEKESNKKLRNLKRRRQQKFHKTRRAKFKQQPRRNMVYTTCLRILRGGKEQGRSTQVKLFKNWKFKYKQKHPLRILPCNAQHGFRGRKRSMCKLRQRHRFCVLEILERSMVPSLLSRYGTVSYSVWHRWRYKLVITGTLRGLRNEEIFELNEQVENHTPCSVVKLERPQDHDALLLSFPGDERFQIKHKWRFKLLLSILELELYLDRLVLITSYAHQFDIISLIILMSVELSVSSLQNQMDASSLQNLEVKVSSKEGDLI